MRIATQTAMASTLPWRLIAGGLLLAAALLGVVATWLWPTQLAALFTAASAMARGAGPLGLAGAALVQVLIALCGILPASMGAVATGVAFGSVTGFLLSGPATLAGAILAFLLSRSLFRPLIARTLAGHPRMEALDEAVARDGWRLVFLLRISPVMPFAVTSYALGLTALRFWPYVLGTLASLPALLGYVILGDLTGRGVADAVSGQARPLHWALLAAAIIATALLTLHLGRIIQRIMKIPATSLP